MMLYSFETLGWLAQYTSVNRKQREGPVSCTALKAATGPAFEGTFGANQFEIPCNRQAKVFSSIWIRGILE